LILSACGDLVGGSDGGSTRPLMGYLDNMWGARELRAEDRISRVELK